MKVEIKVSPQRSDNLRRYGVAKTRVYFSHTSETILDNLVNRRSRPRDLYSTYLPDVAEALGLARTTKFRWSQKAGCGCGCSPGFICDDSHGKVVWVELSADAPRVASDPDSQALAQVRLASFGSDNSLLALPNLNEQ